MDGIADIQQRAGDQAHGEHGEGGRDASGFDADLRRIAGTGGADAIGNPLGGDGRGGPPTWTGPTPAISAAAVGGNRAFLLLAAHCDRDFRLGFDVAEMGDDRGLAVDEDEGHERGEYSGGHGHDQPPQETAGGLLQVLQCTVPAEACQRGEDHADQQDGHADKHRHSRGRTQVGGVLGSGPSP